MLCFVHSPTFSRTSIETEGFHVLSSIGYSFLFVSLYLAFDGKVLPLYRLSFPKIHDSQVDLVWTSLFSSFLIKCKWPNLICQGHASACALTLLGLPSLLFDLSPLLSMTKAPPSYAMYFNLDLISGLN
jgi:hypothetical protein